MNVSPLAQFNYSPCLTGPSFGKKGIKSEDDFRTSSSEGDYSREETSSSDLSKNEKVILCLYGAALFLMRVVVPELLPLVQSDSPEPDVFDMSFPSIIEYDEEQKNNFMETPYRDDNGRLTKVDYYEISGDELILRQRDYYSGDETVKQTRYYASDGETVTQVENFDTDGKTLSTVIFTFDEEKNKYCAYLEFDDGQGRGYLEKEGDEGEFAGRLHTNNGESSEIKCSKEKLMSTSEF